MRQFNDVDLYAPDRADEIDEAFWAMGVKVDSSFYRHSHMYVNGVLVENHHYLLDVRGRKMMESLEADLKDIASACLAEHDGPGLYYPDVRFSLIFNLHHALSHFIYEGISFRFLIDWILFLRRNRDRLNTEQTAEDLNRHMLMKFAAVMTAVCVRYLGLSSADVPDSIRTAMDASDPELVERFIDDLFRPYEQIHYKNIFMQRLHSVRRIVRASWKPEAFLDQSAFDFVFDKFLPVLLGRKYMAD